MNIDIKSPSGTLLLSTPINTGDKGYYSLMRHDYITLPLKLRTPIDFKIGSHADLRGVFDEALGGKLAKMYYVTEKQDPTYNTSTGAYEYQLRLNAYYWLWNNFIFKYTPESTAGEASWSLTAPLDVQLGVFLRNLSELGFTYNGIPYEYSIDSTVENKAVAMTYSNTRLLDALFSMGGENAWNCDVWVTENVIHFGRCEHGDAVKIEIGVEASNMTRNESKGTYATRIYAFGSTRNIPANYRETSNPDLTVNGIVQKRLMLPEDTPYIDAYEDMHPFEVVECVMVNEAIYPRRTGTLSSVTAVDRAIEDSEGNQTGTFKAYQYKDTGLTFDKSYIIEGEELRIVFRSGKLNGLDFGVTFNPNNSDPAEQLWEIVANEDYGRRLPDEVMKPEDGDTYILYGFNIKLVSDQYIPQAQEELKAWAQWKADRMKIDDGTYTVPLRASYVKADQINRTYDVGQKVNLVNPAFFGTTGRLSRVIGWEMSLDIPYDNPIYTIGESAQYSRLSEIEDKVDSIVFNGQTYYGTGGGSGVYVIRTNDSTPASDSNVFSALRSLATFLRKDKDDIAKGLITFLKGIQTGTYKGGVSGAKIDANGSAEFLDLTLRGLQTIGKYVSGVSGGRLSASGWSELEALLIRNGIQTTDFTTGALGAGFCLKKDENGDAYLEVDRMLVRKAATFVELLIQELKHVGGQIVLTPASMKCTRVTESAQYYRCFFDNTDGDRTIQNLFEADDQARCQTFNIEKGTSSDVSNQYYWRLVLSVGDNYIDLSKSDCDTGSTVPQAGDEIVQLGNRTDVTRQTAIVLSAFGEDAPYFKMYRGINSYSLSGKEFVNISRTSVNITADSLTFATGENVKNEIEKAKETASSAQQTVQQAVQAAEEAQAAAQEAREDALAATDELNRLASDDYISPVEKTALRQQQADMQAEYQEIMSDAAKYGISTTAYTTAYNSVATALDKYTAATPEYIPVEADYAHIAAYYDARQTILDAISSAAKNYVDSQITQSSTVIQETVQEAVLQVVDNKITQAVHTEVTTVVGEIEIGGRNLLVGSSNGNGWSGYTDFDADDHCFTRTTTSATETYIYSPYFTLEPGRSITLSFEAKQVNGDRLRQTPDLYILPDDYSTEGFVIGGYAYAASEEWTRVTLTRTVPDSIVSPVRLRFDHNGSEDGSSVSILVRNVKLEYGTIATDWTPAPEDLETLAEQAQATAAEAEQAAAAAAEEALAAQDRLDSWAEDGVISPTEKQALKDEIARIDADKEEITTGYTRYGLGTPTAFNTAYNSYRSQLVTLSAATPEVIAIPSDFAANQTAYYTARTAALNAIAAAAKTYVDDMETSITQTVTDSVLQVLPDEINASVKTEVTTIMGNIKISGRNLLIGSSTGEGWSYESFDEGVFLRTTTGGEKFIQSQWNLHLKPLTEYTVSFDYRSENMVDGEVFLIQENPLVVFASKMFPGQTEWTHFEATLTTTDNETDTGFLRIDNNGTTGGTSSLWVKNVQLEEGNKATVYSPAPEDLVGTEVERIQTWMEGELSVMDDKIAAKVSEETVNEMLGGYVTTSKHQSDLTLLSDQITTTVTVEMEERLGDYVTTSSFNSQITQLSNEISMKVSSSEMNDYKTDWLADANEETAVSIMLNRKFVPDPNFETDYTSRLYSGITRIAASSAPSGCPTSHCGRISGRDTLAMSYFPVTEGEVYYASWYANASQANYNCSIGLQLTKDDGSKNWIITGRLTAGESGWNRKEGYLNIPSGYTKACMFIQMDGRSNFGYLYVTNLIITDGRENIVREEMESEILQLDNEISLRVTKSEFDSLGNRVSDAEAEIELLPDKISLEVQNGINGLSIGGRNLAIGASNGDFLSYRSFEDGVYSQTATTSEKYIESNRIISIEAGKTYTLSFDYKSEKMVTGEYFVVSYSPSTLIYANSTFQNRTEWTHIERTFTASSSRDNCTVRFDNNNATSGTSTLWVRNIQLEEGNKATAYRPAPEDVTTDLLNTGIDIEQKQITITSDKLLIRGASGGTPIAVFKNVNGTPVLQAPYIDVDNLTVKHLEGAEGTFDEIYSTGASQTYGSESEMRLTNRELAFTLYNTSGDIISELHLGGITSQGANAVFDIGANNNNMDYNVVSGIRIDVAGGSIDNPTYNARTMGNHALLIEHGDICGFRLFTRNLTSGGTFTVDTLTSNIRCFNTVNLNIQLPTNAQSSWDDGHMLFIRRCASGAVTLKGNLRTRWTQDAISSSLSISDAEMWVLQYHKNGNYWFVNYMPNF